MYVRVLERPLLKSVPLDTVVSIIFRRSNIYMFIWGGVLSPLTTFILVFVFKCYQCVISVRLTDARLVSEACVTRAVGPPRPT